MQVGFSRYPGSGDDMDMVEAEVNAVLSKNIIVKAADKASYDKLLNSGCRFRI